MSRIDVGKTDLEKAWKRHETVGRKDQSHDSHLLLLIYAVECCLYHCLLTREQIHHTSRIARDLNFGHEIDKLANELGAPGLRGYTAETPWDEYITPENFHSLFRYGGKLKSVDRIDLLKRLENILQWAAEY